MQCCKLPSLGLRKPEALPQLTRTAATGIVGQPVNELDPDCTLSVQF